MIIKVYTHMYKEGVWTEKDKAEEIQRIAQGYYDDEDEFLERLNNNYTPDDMWNATNDEQRERIMQRYRECIDKVVIKPIDEEFYEWEIDI